MTLRSARVRTIAISLVAGAMLAATPSSAHATRPDRTPGDLTQFSFTFGPGEFLDPCGFPIEVRGISRESFTVFSSGSVLIAGTYKLTVTNLQNGKSLDINASGPGRIDAGNNFSGTGLQVFFLGPDEALGGGILRFSGNTSFTLDDSGLVTSITSRGTQSGNVCADIADPS